jgi:hypothetical protein
MVDVNDRLEGQRVFAVSPEKLELYLLALLISASVAIDGKRIEL